jgi:hypothetical protein
MDYHQRKYLKYKEKYMQLKQFKNNNDFEGGVFGLPSLPGYSKLPSLPGYSKLPELPELPSLPGKHYFNVIESSMNLQYVPPNERTESLCLIAVKRMGRALMYVPVKYRTYDMCLIAVKLEGGILSSVPRQHRDFFMCYTAIALSEEKNYDTIKNVYTDKMSSNEFNVLVENAAKDDNRALNYVLEDKTSAKPKLWALKMPAPEFNVDF